MRGMLLVIASFGLTILAWGLYGPTLHEGQLHMSTVEGEYARLRPFICVGLAYFLIAVVAPVVLLRTRGEQGQWTSKGVMMSLTAGALGAIGALGIVMAFTFGGRPSFVMPIVFGGAPVVNSFLTIYWAKRMKEIGPLFLTGLLMVLLGAITVLLFKPSGPPQPKEPKAITVTTEEGETIQAEVTPPTNERFSWPVRTTFQLLSIGVVVCCWGAYGPVLHHGQAAMDQSRLRPLLCVGLAYFLIAVLVPWVLLKGPLPEASTYNFFGTAWSLAAGAAGAIGALGIIMAFNFGGRPVYVMPLVFGGAPVVNTMATVVAKGRLGELDVMTLAGFFAGLILVIAGAVIVLVFAPKGPPPKKDDSAEETEASEEERTDPEPQGDSDDRPADQDDGAAEEKPEE